MSVGWSREAWELAPVFQSASLDVTNQNSTAGSYFESTVAFSLPKISLNQEGFISEIRNQLWALLLLDQNGQWILVGDADFPMRFTVDSKTGSDISDLNNHQFKFTGKSPFRPLFMDKPF